MKIYKEAGQLPVRKKGTLFAYKHYVDQEPLNLSEGLLKSLIESASNPSAENQENCVIASKVLLKVMVDLFSAGHQEAIDQIFTIFLDLLAGNELCQKHAFDLLLNFAVHANMFADYLTSEGQDDNISYYLRLPFFLFSFFFFLFSFFSFFLLPLSSFLFPFFFFLFSFLLFSFFFFFSSIIFSKKKIYNL